MVGRGLDSYNSLQDLLAGFYGQGNEYSVSIKGTEFLKYLFRFYFLKKLVGWLIRHKDESHSVKGNI
jgi:hypothetical protein